jgi:hypothetical protein
VLAIFEMAKRLAALPFRLSDRFHDDRSASAILYHIAHFGLAALVKSLSRSEPIRYSGVILIRITPQ